MQERRNADEGLTEILQTIVDRLRTEFDLATADRVRAPNVNLRGA